MNIHLIAIGGSAMHNMALALHHKGFKVSGSDDAIFEPSKTRLDKYRLLPAEMGWFDEKITSYFISKFSVLQYSTGTKFIT